MESLEQKQNTLFFVSEENPEKNILLVNFFLQIKPYISIPIRNIMFII